MFEAQNKENLKTTNELSNITKKIIPFSLFYIKSLRRMEFLVRLFLFSLSEKHSVIIQ
jgi:hypothetical protein